MLNVPGPRLNPKLFDRKIRLALGLSIDEPKVTIHPMNYGKFSGDKAGSGASRDAYINQMLVSALFQSVQSKKALKAFHDSLQDHYMLRLIKNGIYHDVFYKFVDPKYSPAGLPITVEASNEKLKNRVIEKLEELRVRDIVKEILDATLYLGEYLLFYDEKEDQVDETLIDQTSWRSVYQRGKLAKIVAYTNSDRLDELKDRAIIFRIKYLPLKLSVLGEDEYPFYAYIGQGIIGIEILNLINTIRLIETLLPINQVMNVQAGQLVYARFPEAPTDIGSAFDIARQYERLLNAGVEASSNLSSGPVSLQDIVSSIAKWRVIPLFGDKGSIEPRELPRPNPIDMQTINYLKQALSDAIPLPPAYLGIQDTTGGNQDRNKLAQYYTMISEIRAAIADFADVVVRMSLSRERSKISGEFSINPVNISGIVENQMGDYFDLTAFISDAIQRTILSLADIQDRASAYVNTPAIAKAFNRLFEPLTGGEPIIFVEALGQPLMQGPEGQPPGGPLPGEGEFPLEGEEEQPEEELPLEGEEGQPEEEAEAEEEGEQSEEEEEGERKKTTRLGDDLLGGLFG